VKVLCTMPGKFGDILWSLPTVRCLREAAGEPVDLVTSPTYGSIIDLIHGQPYIGKAMVHPKWEVRDTAPMTPQRPPEFDAACYDKVIHLGYERWPQNLLPVEIYLQATGQWGKELPKLDLDTPWIQVDPEWDFCWEEHETYAEYRDWHPDVHVGWSDEWVELKMGVTYALTGRGEGRIDYQVLTAPGSRVEKEWLIHYPGAGDEFDETFENLSWYAAGWKITADALSHAKIFLGCLSSQWVLANALGKPTVIMEPNPHRHNSIFFYGHPRNHLVRGNDGKPTFDARHVADMVKEVLGGTSD